MNDLRREDGLSKLLASWAAEEVTPPVRITPGILRLKADLARSDRARAKADRVERWAFGLAGVLLLLASLSPLGHSCEAPHVLAAEGVSGLVVLAAAGWSLARSIQA